MSLREEDEDFRSFLYEDCWKVCFCGFLDEEAETTADVNLGSDLAMAMLADLETSSVVDCASFRRRSLSNSLSMERDEDSKAFLWLSDKVVGKSFAKCSLLFSRKKANNDDDRVIVSASEPPRNLFIALNKSGSAGTKSVRLISLDRTSIIHPVYDWTA